MSSDYSDITNLIKTEAIRLGFDFCGIARAGRIEADYEKALRTWLDNKFNADMDYMSNHFDKRTDSGLIVDNAASVIVVALNYYPQVKQPLKAPQFAYYAYGEDYHNVIKEKLSALFQYMQQLHPDVSGRVFADTAPVLERYWAQQAGIGFIGKNTQLIIPKRGSYFFLGEIICSLPLVPDTPAVNRCGTCNKCIESCPSQAIRKPFVLDANRCISYQTIENRDEIPASVKSILKNRVFGCDTCQMVCPWNRFARPNTVSQFTPTEEFLRLDKEKLLLLDENGFRQIFGRSAVKRTKYTGLKRNIEALE